MPATAPRMITTPIAMKNDMRANTTPTGPYFRSFEMTMPEKTTEKTASMPSQNTPVATAGGSSLRHETRPPSRSHMVNHQKKMNPIRPTIANTAGPAALTAGPTTTLVRNSQPTQKASQVSLRCVSFTPRPSSPAQYPDIDRRITARLTESQAWRYQREPSRAVLQRKLRQYQLAGHDTSQLIDQITAAPMDGARSISSLLHGRLQRVPLPDLGHAVTWARRTPEGAPQIAHELAADLDKRRQE